MKAKKQQAQQAQEMDFNNYQEFYQWLQFVTVTHTGQENTYATNATGKKFFTKWTLRENTPNYFYLSPIYWCDNYGQYYTYVATDEKDIEKIKKQASEKYDTIFKHCHLVKLTVDFYYLSQIE